MRIDEITKKDFDDRMAIRGHKIHSGSFGSVYVRDASGTVYKLFKEEDSAYLKFIEIAVANPNRHFPVFKSRVFSARFDDADYRGIKIEKLDPLEQSDAPYSNEWQAYLLSGMIVLRNSYDTDSELIDAVIEDDNSFKSDSQDWRKHTDEVAARSYIADLKNRYSSFLEAGYIISKNMGRYYLDIKFGSPNVMKRGSVLVYSDPLCI